MWWRMWSVSRWPQVRASVVRTRIKDIHIDEGEIPVPGYQPEITYQVDGQGEGARFNGLCLDPIAFQFHRLGEAKEFLAPYPVGASVQAHVSPNGKQAFLLYRLDWRRTSHYLAAFIGGILVAVFGFCILTLMQT